MFENHTQEKNEESSGFSQFTETLTIKFEIYGHTDIRWYILYLLLDG